MNRRLNGPGERDRTIPGQQLLPARERARRRDRLGAPADDVRPTAAQKLLARHHRAGATARVQGHEPLLFGRPDEGEHVSADTRHHRLDDRQNGRRGHGGVDGIPAVLENRERGFRRQRLAGRRNAMRRIDG